MTEQLQIETELIAKLLRESEAKDSKWEITTSIDDVPAETGHYALHDGLDSRGCGVTYNMRSSIQSSSWFKQLRRPIYFWLPDTDGSAALWLQGKTICPRCPTRTVIEFFEEDAHDRDVHNIYGEYGAD